MDERKTDERPGSRKIRISLTRAIDDSVQQDQTRQSGNIGKKKSQRDSTRQLGGIFDVPPEDEDHEETKRCTRGKLERPMALAIPCLTQHQVHFAKHAGGNPRRCTGGNPLTERGNPHCCDSKHAANNRPTYVRVAARSHRRKRLQINASLRLGPHTNSDDKAMKILDANTAADQERDKQKNSPAWDTKQV